MGNATHAEALHHGHDSDSTDVFGFWLYILTDCVLFGCLFATYIVLAGPMAPGPILKDYVSLHDVFWETMALLASNFTFCLAMLQLYKNNLNKVVFWLGITFLFGAIFISMELTEFAHLIGEGFRYDLSAHASSFFTLVGTHGLHVSVGLCWIILMMIQLPILKINALTRRRMTYLGLFWNFLDIVWIFVFTVVYLTGAL